MAQAPLSKLGRSGLGSDRSNMSYLDGGPRTDPLVETEGKKAPGVSIPELDYQT